MDERSRDEYFMGFALEEAHKGLCSRRNSYRRHFSSRQYNHFTPP